MIDFNSYETMKLSDVAEFERAKQGYVYPWGCSTIQISASRGQVGYLDKPSEVPSKEVVVIPSAGINRKYFNIVIRKNMDWFMSKYATGLNIKEHEIGNFPVELHNQETQEAVVRFWDFVDNQEKITKNELNQAIAMKKRFLNKMFV